jgi:YD repeat-containing protein
MYREFIYPDDKDVYEAIGEWPDSDEIGARILTLQDNSGQSLTFSYDGLARSVRIHWVNNQGIEIVDFFQGGATRLSFTSGQSTKNIVIDFHTGECTGTTEIQVTPHLSVRDRLLFQ